MKRLLLCLIFVTAALAQVAPTPVPRMQFFDANGKPLAGGYLYTYLTNTFTLAPSYTDYTGLVLNSNPIVLDASGSGNVWLNTTIAYRLVLQNSGHVQQYQIDGIQVGSGGGGSMVWPTLPGIPNYTGTLAWGTSYSSTNPIPVNFIGTFIAGANGFGTAAFVDIANYAPLASPVFSGVIKVSLTTDGCAQWVSGVLTSTGAACGAGGGGANVALSNLASVATNAPLNPGVDNSINLNAPNLRYINAWFAGLIGNANSGSPFAGLSFQTGGVANFGNGTLNDVTGTINAATANFGSSMSVGGGSTACGTFTACMAFTFANTGTTSPLALNGYFAFKSSNSHVWVSLGSTDFDSLLNFPAVFGSVTGLFTGCTTAQYLGSDGNCHLAPLLLPLTTNFNTAANTSLQTFLTATMPASTSGRVGFNCDFTWSQATALVAVTFGVQAATTAPNNLEASGVMYPTPSTLATGTLTAITNTTAQNVVAATGGVVGTIYRAELTGTLGFASNASPTVLNFMVSTATLGDVVTLYQGSKCVLNFQ